MHGINVENKGFKSLTDYVRVRYIPSASSKAYVGQKVRGVYWNGYSAATGQVATKQATENVWRAIKVKDGSLVILNAAQTETIHSRADAGVAYPFEGRKFVVESVAGTDEASIYAHTLLF